MSAAFVHARRHGAAAIAHAFQLGWRETCAQPGALVGVFLSYSVIVSLWASLYKLLPAAALERIDVRYADLVWYLAVTEIVAFSNGHAYREIQDEIQSGSVSAHLVRPLGYVSLIAAQALGRMTAKVGALAVHAGVLAFALTRESPLHAGALLTLAPAIVAGAGLLLAVQILVGLSTAWLGTARPLFFIVQKLFFVLGGLVLPLDAYPDALAKIAWLTPFPAMLHAPGSVALASSVAHAAPLLAVQIAWLGVAWIAVAAAGRALERRIVRAGVCG